MTPRTWPERLTFAALVAAFLVPIWFFRYLPTQDGPAHLGNAIILRDYGAPGTRYDEFFQLSFEPFPNWAAHLLLAGLSAVVPPLVAEKLLATLYVAGFAYACRYFLASWPGASLALTPLCLLFAYNRCFFMGFYSFCLSVPLIFLILGTCVRLPDRPSPLIVLLLAGLFALAYFSHLVGLGLAAIGALVLAASLPGRRWFRLLLVGAALLPAAAFAGDYLVASGFSVRVITDAVGRSLTGPERATGLFFFGHHLFIPLHGWSFPVGTCVLALYVVLALSALWPSRAADRGKVLWLPLLALAAAMTAIHIVGPATFGHHGGYLKARYAILVPIVWLALLRLPAPAWQRFTLLGATYALLLAHLIAIGTHFAAANQTLERYTAGVQLLRGGGVLYVIQSKFQEPYEVSPLLHASHYYCLETGTTNLDNYEANAHYFPVHFRPGVVRGRGERRAFESYPRRADVDRVMAWEWPGRAGQPPAGFREVFRSGSLALYEREK